MKKKHSWLNYNFKPIDWVDQYAKHQKVKGTIRLDSNENFVLDRDFVAGVSAEPANQVYLREYPLDQMDELYARLSQYVGVSVKCVAVGSGSDQIIELLLSTLGGRRATVF